MGAAAGMVGGDDGIKIRSGVVVVGIHRGFSPFQKERSFAKDSPSENQIIKMVIKNIKIVKSLGFRD